MIRPREWWCCDEVEQQQPNEDDGEQGFVVEFAFQVPLFSALLDFAAAHSSPPPTLAPFHKDDYGLGDPIPSVGSEKIEATSLNSHNTKVHTHSKRELPLLPPPLPPAGVSYHHCAGLSATPEQPADKPISKPIPLLLRKSTPLSLIPKKTSPPPELQHPTQHSPESSLESVCPHPTPTDQAACIDTHHHVPPSVRPPPPPPKIPQATTTEEQSEKSAKPTIPTKPIPPPPSRTAPPPPPPSTSKPPPPAMPKPTPPHPGKTTPLPPPLPSADSTDSIPEPPSAILEHAPQITPPDNSPVPPTTNSSALTAFHALPPLKRTGSNRGLNRTSSLAAFKKSSAPASEVFQNEGGLSSSSSFHGVARKIVPRMTPIVVDTGSSYVKAGVAGEEIPRCLVPSMVGYEDDYIFVGPNALHKDKLKVSCPVDPRSDVDWEGISEIWEHTFLEELGIDPTTHPMLLTELPNMSAKSREDMTDVFFNNLCVPALHIANPAVLSLYSLGLFTGLVVDCGNRLQIVPVIDGHVIEAAVYKLKRGVAGLTEHMARLLTRKGYFFNMSSAMQTDQVRKIKESVCYVALEPEKELARKEREINMDFTLPDGKVITVGQERFLCPEVLFKPNDIGLDVPGLHASLCDCVSRCPIDYRKELLSHIVLIGGSTLFQGFEERLENEVFARVSKGGLRRREIKCIAPHNRKYLAWFGGSVLANMPDFVSSRATWADEDIKRQYTS
ncbi:actin subfamily protein [Pelomyxa schiedti]|nr:actin subfamily protein [Pelomyxa schiedti]